MEMVMLLQVLPFTLTVEAITTLSEAPGTIPPTQVAPLDHKPPPGAETICEIPDKGVKSASRMPAARKSADFEKRFFINLILNVTGFGK